jgi:hypothetical protein
MTWCDDDPIFSLLKIRPVDPRFPFLRILESVPPLSVLLESAEWLDFMPPDLGQVRTYTGRRGQPPHCPRGSGRIEVTLDLPDWLPHAVRDKALSIFAALTENDEEATATPTENGDEDTATPTENDDEDTATLTENDDEATEKKKLLLRLASDSRMMEVWQELYKYKRASNSGTKEFVYKPSFHEIGCAHTARLTVAEIRRQIEDSDKKVTEEDIEEFICHLSPQYLQPWPEAPRDPQASLDLAVRYIFQHAYLSALVKAPILTTQEIVENFHERIATADQLRKEADKLKSYGMEDDAWTLIRIAQNCEENIRTGNLDNLCDRWIVDRDRSTSHLRAYVITLAALTRKLFGNPLHGTLARIANVAFDLAGGTSITGGQVHEMLRGPRHVMTRSVP